MAELVVTYYSKHTQYPKKGKGWWFTLNSAPSVKDSFFKTFNFFYSKNEDNFFIPWIEEGIRGWWTPSISLAMNAHKYLMQQGVVVKYEENSPFDQEFIPDLTPKEKKRWNGDYNVVRKTLLVLMQFSELEMKDLKRISRYWKFLRKNGFLLVLHVKNLIKLCKRPKYLKELRNKGLTRIVKDF